MHWAVRDAVDYFYMSGAVYPAKERNAAAFSAQINGNSCGFLHGEGLLSGCGLGLDVSERMILFVPVEVRAIPG
jgi:hypothetical protein